MTEKEQAERARQLEELLEAPTPAPARSPHAFVQEQMRKTKTARKGKPSAPRKKKQSGD